MANVHDQFPLTQLLVANKRWAEDVKAAEPDFFEKSAKGQTPHTLWIGCSDSRVPESVITGVRPGEVFVHRNIANQVHLNDNNVLSVLDYAVNHLGVQHVVVVGHTECGGASACFSTLQNSSAHPDHPLLPVPTSPPNSPINSWLEPLAKLARSLHLSTVPRLQALPILVEENVKVQVDNLCRTATISEAWIKRQNVFVHGWLYNVGEGTLQDLIVTRGPPGTVVGGKMMI